MCNLCNWLGRSQDPSTTCQVPLRSARRRIRLEPKEERVRKSPVGMADRVKPESGVFLLKELQRLGPPPRSSSKMASRARLERTGGKVLVCSLAQGQITSRPSPRSSPVQLRAAHLLRLPLTLQPRRVGNARSVALFAQLGPLTKSDLKSYSISGPCQK